MHSASTQTSGMRYGPGAANPIFCTTPGPLSAYAPVSAQHQIRAATSVPSDLAPSFTRTRAGWRLSVWNSSLRSSTALTGRPALRASAATIASRRTKVLPPKEPPIGSHTTRTSCGATRKTRPRSERTLNGVAAADPEAVAHVRTRLRSHVEVRRLVVGDARGVVDECRAGLPRRECVGGRRQFFVVD